MKRAVVALAAALALSAPAPAHASGPSVPLWAMVILFPLAVIADLLEPEERGSEEAERPTPTMPASGEE